MIELMARSAPARSVEWVAGDVKLRTPLVISSPAFPLGGLKWADSPDGRSVRLDGKELFSFAFGLEIPLAQLEREGKGERRCGQGCAIVKGAVTELGEEEVVILSLIHI